MAALPRNSRLEATKSFIKMMSDMAQQRSQQTVDAMAPAPTHGLQLISIKSATTSVTRTSRRDSWNWIFS